MKKFLVTGADGYIGRHLVDYLLENENCSVVGLDKKYTINGIAHEKKFLYKIGCNLADEKSAFDASSTQNDFDAIFHLAALTEMGEGALFPSYYIDNNLMATKNLKYFLSDDTSIIFASTGSINFMNDFSGYPTSKMMCEMYLMGIETEYKNPVRVLRLGNVSGRIKPNIENHNPETHLIPKLMYGKNEIFTIFGDGNQFRNYVYVGDVCRAFHLAYLHAEEKKKFYLSYDIGGPEGKYTREVVDLCLAELKRRGMPIPTIEYGPERKGDVSGIVLDMENAHMDLNWYPTLGVEEIIQTM